MAEQTQSLTATNLPVDGQSIVAANVTTDVTAIITDYNKSVPLTKISSDQSWTSWIPTFFANDGTTALTATIDFARYVRVGRTITAVFSFSSVHDPSGATFYFVLPVSARSESANFRVVGAGYAAFGGSQDMSYALIAQSDTTKCGVRKSDASNWAAATNNGAVMTITYEATS